MLGAICGVLGVTAVIVFATNVDRLVATPRLYGSSWDFEVNDTTSNTPCGAGNYGLARERGIDALAEVCSQNVTVDGHLAGAVAFTPLRGAPIGPEVLAGRLPNGPREVALGSKTLESLGKHIGDTVRITVRESEADYAVVGRVVVPTFGTSQTLGDGATFTGAGYAPLFDQNLFTRYFVGRFTRGADRAAVQARIDARPQVGTSTTPTVPVEVNRLREIGWLPGTLAAFLGFLALLAVGYALVTSVRRRRRDLALLKTLGFDRHQVRATVAWEATTLGAIGLVVGLPVGVVVGRFAWRLLADGLGVSNVTRLPVLAVLLVIPAVLVVVNLVAFFPARAAARTRAAVALRAE
jgi:hypothetical protein